jgi:hypothetical protein
VTAGDSVTWPGGDGGHDPGAAADSGAERCVCLVAGYGRHAAKVTAVLAQAERLIARSPLLDDFLTVRFLSLGPQPAGPGDGRRSAWPVTAELRAMRAGGGRSHFAVIVIEKSALAIEELLGACAAEPLLAGLRVRFTGIASREDRPADARTADIACSPSGNWDSERAIVGALYGQCEALPRYFAARGEPGLTAAEIRSLQWQRPRAEAVDGADGEPGAASGWPEADALDDDGSTSSARAAQGASSGAASVADRRVALAVSWRPPGLHWPRRRRETSEVQSVQSVPAPKATALVYLLAPVEPNAAADPALSRLQAVLQEVDQRLSAQPACAFLVRLLHGDDAEFRGEVRAAGMLSRRDSRRPFRSEDFAGLLRGVRAALRRDNARLGATASATGLAVARPAVVIASADPPMAERAAAAAFADLAAEATLIWVVPRKSEGLVSPVFAGVSGVTVFAEHAAVADDISDLLLWPGAVSVPEKGEAR